MLRNDNDASLILQKSDASLILQKRHRLRKIIQTQLSQECGNMWKTVLQNGRAILQSLLSRFAEWCIQA
eukprot:5259609-Pleurochrysis_carterae.AAC.1